MAGIIIAEDDEILGPLIRATLTEAGHAVGLLADGAQGLQAIRLKRPDLVILDCNMPGLPGVEVLRQIRASADLYALPVLMLTGRRSALDVELAMNAGADEYIKKPFDPDQLVATIDVMLESARRRGRLSQ